MQFLKRLFGRKVKTVPDVIKELVVGDQVFLEYRHPRDVGILDGNGLAFTRLNGPELENRRIRGTISHVRKEGSPLNTLIIEIATYDSPAMPGQLRKFLFLPDEIKEIRKVQ